jgi:hypothetical protein
LPRGGNLNGIQWEQFPDPVGLGDMIGFLQHNAACQWVRAYADNRQRRDAATVLSLVPRWISFRGERSARTFPRLLAGIRDADALEAECRASATRERRYARSLDLPASQ